MIKEMNDQELIETRYKTHANISALRRDVNLLALPSICVERIERQIKAAQEFLRAIENELIERGDYLRPLDEDD